MMGKFVVMMKRWWVLALVFTLALSLTSCSKRKSNLQAADYGFGYCDGSIGSFDVYVIPSKGSPGLYELSIIPVSVNAGDIAKIVVLNQSLSYKPMLNQVVLQNEQEIFAGHLTESEVSSYDTLAIIPWDPSQENVTPIEQNNDKDALCALPLPGYETGDGLSDVAP